MKRDYIFRPLRNHNKGRDERRRKMAEDLLNEYNIPFTNPTLGAYRISSSRHGLIMFYPKSGKLVWPTKGPESNKFQSADGHAIAAKINELR